MKRIELMVALLIAGALSLVFFALQARIFLPLVDVFQATGSGGIGSVSVGFSESFVESVPVLFPSFLLWRICANLVAGGERAMAWHRRFHRAVTIAGLLLIAMLFGVFALALTIGPQGEHLPPSSVWIWLIVAVMVMVPPAALGLAAIQLFSVVMAFRTLVHSGQPAS